MFKRHCLTFLKKRLQEILIFFFSQPESTVRWLPVVLGSRGPQADAGRPPDGGYGQEPEDHPRESRPLDQVQLHRHRDDHHQDRKVGAFLYMGGGGCSVFASFS